MNCANPQGVNGNMHICVLMCCRQLFLAWDRMCMSGCVCVCVCVLLRCSNRQTTARRFKIKRARDALTLRMLACQVLPSYVAHTHRIAYNIRGATYLAEKAQPLVRFVVLLVLQQFGNVGGLVVRTRRCRTHDDAARCDAHVSKWKLLTIVSMWRATDVVGKYEWQTGGFAGSTFGHSEPAMRRRTTPTTRTQTPTINNDNDGDDSRRKLFREGGNLPRKYVQWGASRTRLRVATGVAQVGGLQEPEVCRQTEGKRSWGDTRIGTSKSRCYC